MLVDQDPLSRAPTKGGWSLGKGRREEPQDSLYRPGSRVSRVQGPLTPEASNPVFHIKPEPETPSGFPRTPVS